MGDDDDVTSVGGKVLADLRVVLFDHHFLRFDHHTFCRMEALTSLDLQRNALIDTLLILPSC